MNYHPIFSQHGPGSQVHDRFGQGCSRPAQFFYPSQHRANDDLASVMSDSTINMQDPQNTIKPEIKEKLLNMIDSNQSSLNQLESSILTEISENSSLIISKINEIKTEIDPKVHKKIETLKEMIFSLEKQNQENHSNLQQELQTILKDLKNLENPIKRKRSSVKINFKNICYFPKRFKNRVSLPCICLLQQSSFRTRSSVIKAYEKGELSCKCNPNNVY
jgi:cob(I)alamin adenosyltransferase